MRMTLPNWITLARLGLAVAFFVCLAQFDAGRRSETVIWIQVAFWIFVIAGLSDYIDGELARRLHQISVFGRVMDPVADKVLICGGYAFLAGANFVHAGASLTAVAPWMAVVILGRELLVTSLRAQREAGGGDFSAAWSGKLKMVVQTVVLGAILAQISVDARWGAPLLPWLTWLVVLVTLWSLFTYLGRAWSFLSESGSLPQKPTGKAADAERRAGGTAPPSGLRANMTEAAS